MEVSFKFCSGLDLLGVLSLTLSSTLTVMITQALNLMHDQSKCKNMLRAKGNMIENNPQLEISFNVENIYNEQKKLNRSLNRKSVKSNEQITDSFYLTS